MNAETLEKAKALDTELHYLTRQINKWRQYEIGRCESHQLVGRSSREELGLTHVPKEVVSGFRASVIAVLEAKEAKLRDELARL